MKKWLLAAGLGLAMATSAQAADKIAIVNMGNLFQQVAQKTGVSNTLENEFKGRAAELQKNGNRSAIQNAASAIHEIR
ncbi:outer membrane protein OmpH [Salmonella enterica subsp. arizonae]|nr:outer membrane protein OmpH [Salmonella enterica subsp. arizonae]